MSSLFLYTSASFLMSVFGIDDPSFSSLWLVFDVSCEIDCHVFTHPKGESDVKVNYPRDETFFQIPKQGLKTVKKTQGKFKVSKFGSSMEKFPTAYWSKFWELR